MTLKKIFVVLSVLAIAGCSESEVDVTFSGGDQMDTDAEIIMLITETGKKPTMLEFETLGLCNDAAKEVHKGYLVFVPFMVSCIRLRN